MKAYHNKLLMFAALVLLRCGPESKEEKNSMDEELDCLNTQDRKKKVSA